jgi:hypothetical protein
MSKEKMKFPIVAGDTPREQFMNLARHVISVPKAQVASSEPPKRRRKKARSRVPDPASG